MVWDAVSQVEMAKPAVCRVQMHFFAESPFRPDTETIADQQHPDQQFGIDRRTPCMAVKTGQMNANAVQIYKLVNRPQQVILGDMIFQ